MVYWLICVFNIKFSKNEKQIQIKRFIMTMNVFKNEKTYVNRIPTELLLLLLKLNQHYKQL